MKRFIVYAGANGAGKSSLRAVASDPVDLEIDPDRIAREINPLDPRSVDFEAGKEALNRFDRAIEQGLSFSLETTLTGRGVLGRMQAARGHGFSVLLRYVAVDSVATNIRRVTARVVQGGHFIDSATIARRVAGSLANLPAAIAIASEAILVDNTETEHVRVMEIRDGRITFQAQDTPKWLAPRLPQILAALAAAERGTGG